MSDAGALRARLADVRNRLAKAAGRAGRDPSSVRLVAVSKAFPVDLIRAAADAGQVDFGENKVQEAFLKMDQTTDLPLRWHLIGHLQSNKARKAGRFDVVHSIDDRTLVDRLEHAASAADRDIEMLAQVDLTSEPTKHGAREDALAPIFEAARVCQRVHLIGLMVLPPAVTEPEAARPFFRALQDVRTRLLDRGVDRSMLAELSMGMSHDFEVAVEEGGTMVRIGTAIFGPRPQ